MRLEELVPKEKDLLEMSVEQLALNVLKCLIESPTGASIRRRGLASRLVMGYSNEFGKDTLFALEEAVMWLEHNMLIGVDPQEQEFVFVTRAGRERAGEKAVCAVR
jgi:hypothetical protein